MLINYLKIAFRNLWKDKGYSMVNILGLSIGLAVCLLIFLLIRYEFSFNNFHKNEDRIYRVVTSWKYPNGMHYSEGTPLPLPDAMSQDFPGIEKVAAIAQTGYLITVPAQGNEVPDKYDESGKIFYVQPQFYKMFNFPWLLGKPETLKEPNTAALTQSIAEKYFGDWHNAIGQTIVLNNKTQLRITGVIKDLPENTNLPINIAISYSTFPRHNDKRWVAVSTGWQCYVLLKKNINIKQLESKLPAFTKKYIKDNSIANGKTSFHFQPLKGIHFNQQYGAYGHQADKTELKALGLVGIFILLIACINFINMATAQAVSRSKEVGIRKVLGSRRLGLMLQFIGETMLITIFAMFLACIITELILPSIQNLLDQPVTFNIMQHPATLLFMALIVLLTGFLAGFYPALIMSGFDPVTALKNKISKRTSGGIGVRQTLVVVQFTVTLVLIIGTLVIMKQMNFFRNKPMGFDRSAIALVSLPNDSMSTTKYETFKGVLSQVPGIKEMSFCTEPPSSKNYSLNNVISFNNRKLSFSFPVITNFADTGFFSTFGLNFVAGHAFKPSDTIKEFVVNETFIKKLGISNPQDAIGKEVKMGWGKAPIVGVLKDFVNRSLEKKIDPVILSTRKGYYDEIVLKLRPEDIQKTMKAVELQFNKFFPKNIYSANFYDKKIADYYINEARLAKLFKTFAIIVLLISAIGLLSLLSFVTSQRTKEIAVRKVLGASGSDILQLIGKSFIVMVIIANLIAWPIAYILAQKWLNGFAYRIDMPVMPFMVATIISLLLIIITVGWQVWRAEKANVAEALKYE